MQCQKGNYKYNHAQRLKDTFYIPNSKLPKPTIFDPKTQDKKLLFREIAILANVGPVKQMHAMQ